MPSAKYNCNPYSAATKSTTVRISTRSSSYCTYAFDSVAIGMKVKEEDEFNYMITMIMFSEKNGISDVIEDYHGRAYV